MTALRFMLAIAAVSFASSAYAGCELSSSPCSTDSFGHTYRNERNLGGGYTTYRDGSTYSTTNQNLGGGYTESYTGGGQRNYNYDPYRSPAPTSGYHRGY